MLFRAKYEKSIIVMLFVMPVVMVTILQKRIEFSMKDRIIILFVCYCIVSLLGAIIVSTKYILTDEALVISRLGIKKYIPYREIDEIHSRKGRWTMEAPSLEQVWLMKDKKLVIALSPEEKEKFKSCMEEYIKIVSLK